MKSKLRKVLAATLTVMLFCSACGLGNSTTGITVTTVAAESAANEAQETETVEAGNEEGANEVTVGLARDVYEIPDYINNVEAGTKIVRLSVSMGASDYGVSASGVMFKTFVDRLEELSGGTMVAQVYPANQLASSTDDIINGLVTNAFEFAEVGVGNWGDYTTAFTPCNTPFIFPNDETTYKVMSGEIGDQMIGQLLEDTGIRATGFMYLGMRTITNNTKEIHLPSDLKGMKIRVQSDPTELALFEELGASTMTVSFSELFTALQQKLCDGQDNPIISIVSRKFYEVQGYITMLNHLPNISMFVCSDDYYQSLSEEEQAWIDEASQDATQACYQALIDTQNTLRSQLEAYGIVITDLTEEEYNAFVESSAKTRASCEEIIGEEGWSKLMVAIEESEG
ncbi:MAG: TRAP transporter substrate-binding protein [Clostridiales bacterium]|nr:TRAP transporter substrate-binding protein [Clostridiales bacterium]